MKIKILLSVVLLLFGFKPQCQNLEEKIQKEDIRIYVGLQFNNYPSYPTSVITFNESGNITYFHRGILNPIQTDSAKHYCAEYIYTDNNRLYAELVYEIEEKKLKVLRTTSYIYKQDTISIKTLGKNGLLAEMMEINSNVNVQ